MTLRWVSTTPFGSPVVPEVYTTVSGWSVVISSVSASKVPAVQGAGAADGLVAHEPFVALRGGAPVQNDHGAQVRQVVQHGTPAPHLLLALQNQDGGRAVPGDVADLFRAQGVVRAAGQGPEVDGGQVCHPVLRPPGHRDEHPLTPLQARGGQSAGDRGHLGAQLEPGQGAVVGADPGGEGRRGRGGVARSHAAVPESSNPLRICAVAPMRPRGLPPSPCVCGLLGRHTVDRC